MVSDAEAVDGCIKLLEFHRTLVEPACGAALAAIQPPYSGNIFRECKSVVVIICGGSVISTDLLESWKNQFEL